MYCLLRIILPKSVMRCWLISTPYMADFYEIEKELDFIVATNSIIGVKEAHYSYKNSLNQGFAVVVDKSSNLSATIKEIYDKTHLKRRICINNAALADGVPQRLNLKEMITHFVNYRMKSLSGKVRYPKRVMADEINYIKAKYQAQRKTKLIHSLNEVLDDLSFR